MPKDNSSINIDLDGTSEKEEVKTKEPVTQAPKVEVAAPKEPETVSDTSETNVGAGVGGAYIATGGGKAVKA